MTVSPNADKNSVYGELKKITSVLRLQDHHQREMNQNIEIAAKWRYFTGDILNYILLS